MEVSLANLKSMTTDRSGVIFPTKADRFLPEPYVGGQNGDKLMTDSGYRHDLRDLRYLAKCWGVRFRGHF